MKKIVSMLLCAALLLPLSAEALAAGEAGTAAGLAVFAGTEEYAEDTFADVDGSSWYAASVRTVYSKGIMNGTTANTFDPQAIMAWTQAVTIAARLHAAYWGKDIPAAEGKWYMRYLEYARENGLLPASCPPDDQADSVPVTREGLAVLFGSVLAPEDLPAVNDLSIPDLDSVREEYREAVARMYAAGIITGRDGGQFQPGGEATRAEVAAIVARMLCPGQRSSHDSRQNPYMVDQMGNFHNGGLAVRLDDTVYYVTRTSRIVDASTDETAVERGIYARTDSGEVRRVYSAGVNTVEYLSAGPDGALYFISHNYDTYQDSLLRLDLETGDVTTIYTAPANRSLGSYLFYDGELYLALNDRVEKFVEGEEIVLAEVDPQSSIALRRTLYCFNGKMYYVESQSDGTAYGRISRLHEMDLETGEDAVIMDDVENSYFIVYYGSTMWYSERPDSDRIIKRVSLALMDVSETLLTLTDEYGSGYPEFYANGSQVYYQSSGGKKVWSVSSSGETEVIAEARTPYYESSCITSQGILLLGTSIVSALTSQQVDMRLPDGQATNLAAFLKLPYYLEGVGQLAAAEEQASWEPNPVGSEFDYDLLKAYITPEGELALEMSLTNNMDTLLTMNKSTLYLEGGVSAAVSFEMNSLRIAAHQSKTVTFVFPADQIEKTGSVADLEIEHTSFIGTYAES